MSDESAAIAAANEIISAKASSIAADKMAQINHALAIPRVTADINRLKSKVNEKTVTGRKRNEGERLNVALQEFLERANVRQEAVTRQAMQPMVDFIEANKSTMAGLKRNDQMMPDIYKELLGEDSGDATAKFFAEGIRKSFDYTHARYKAAGGKIGRLENYAPQRHNKVAIKQVSFDEWFEFLTPKLDRSRMIDFRTGLPFDDARLKEVMRETYDTITTDGRNVIEQNLAEGKGVPNQGRDVFKRNSDSRFFHFKNSEDFLEYNRRFGQGDEELFDMILDHIRLMARDTASMEIMGPKPNAMMRLLDARMAAENVTDVKRKFINGMYDVFIGRVDGLASDNWLLNGIAKTHSLLRASLLGSASISAISDTSFVAISSKLNGLSAMNAVGNYFKLINPANTSDRSLTRDLGYITENISINMNDSNRFIGEGGAYKAFGKIGDFADRSANVINRASGLAHMTKAARDAYAMEFSSFIAREAKKNTAWSKLPQEFTEEAERFGITESDWKIIKKSDMWEADNGSRFFRTQDLIKTKGLDKKQAFGLANKIDDWIEHGRNITTNEPTLRTKAITTGAAFLNDARKGTVGGTAARSFFMFKSFPISVMLNHLIPSIETSVNKGRYGHLASMAIGTTVLGAFAIQLKEYAKGKTARDVDAKFAMAAFLQGGGAGLFGDFLFGDYSRFGRNPIVESLSLGGPVTGLASDVMRTFKGNFDRVLDDKEPNIPRDSINLVKRYMPGANLWYSRLMMERLLFDALEEQIDPKFHQRRRRLERTARDQGQEFWWRKGESAP